jgi:hypothetical protein
MKKLKLLLLCLFLFVGSSCGTGPKVTICLVDVASGGMQCNDPDDNVLFIPFAQADNYVAMSPDDFKRVIDYIRLKCRK